LGLEATRHHHERLATDIDRPRLLLLLLLLL
jgi:hypothetical protein